MILRDRNMVVGPFRDSVEVPAVVLGAEIQYMACRIAVVHLDKNWRDIACAHKVHAQDLEAMVCQVRKYHLEHSITVRIFREDLPKCASTKSSDARRPSGNSPISALD